MALEVRPMDARLSIQFDKGLNQEGKQVVKTKSYGRIRSDISDEDLYDVADALIGLQQREVISIRKTGQSEFVEV